MRFSLALLALAGLASAVDVGWNGRLTGVCTSTGDTHVWNFNNQYFDVMWPGTYVFAKSNDGFFESQVKQGRWLQNLDRITVIKDAAVRCGHDVIEMIVSGGPPGGGSPHSEMRFNGKRLDIGQGQSRDLVHYPDKRPAGRAGIMRVRMLTLNQHVRHWRVECNKGPTVDAPGTFAFEHLVYQYSNWIYGNAMASLDPNVYPDGTMSGYCGFTPDEADSAVESNNCRGHRFMTSVCHRLITVDKEKSLFQDPTWHDKRAEEIQAQDQAKMAHERAECEKVLHATIPKDWLRKQPMDLQDEVGGFIKACTFDGYYGLKYDKDALDDLVCNLVGDQVETLRRQMASAYQALRCMFTYDNALHYDGKVNVRAATEYYWERVDALRTQVENFCTGPCKCAPTEKAEDSPNDKACEDLPSEMKEELLIRFGRKGLPAGKKLDGLYSVDGSDKRGTEGSTPTHAASFREKEVLLMRREVLRATRKNRPAYLRELHEKLARGDVNDDDTVILDDK